MRCTPCSVPLPGLRPLCELCVCVCVCVFFFLFGWVGGCAGGWVVGWVGRGCVGPWVRGCVGAWVLRARAWAGVWVGVGVGVGLVVRASASSFFFPFLNPPSLALRGGGCFWSTLGLRLCFFLAGPLSSPSLSGLPHSPPGFGLFLSLASSQSLLRFLPSLPLSSLSWPLGCIV